MNLNHINIAAPFHLSEREVVDPGSQGGYLDHVAFPNEA